MPASGASGSSSHSENGMYRRLAIMMALSFGCMFALMYAMVDRWSSVVPNINQAYMALLMTAPMLVLEVVLMGAMYPNKRFNRWLVLGGVLLGVLSFWAIRAQVGVGDRSFLRSMIPHHSGAILMCEEADLTDPEVKTLCANIVVAQKEEIERMRQMLAR
ncbi:MAG: DUF305 domain-containing protein [Rhodothermales bacterium]|nr:DUF305 domain-containing protein [Rhodothermales bacterium]